uniref:Brix domain-containing protein n=1 Tax=Glossina brevipalpis TaxID=37001 RepID=A0A1A9WKW3_9MUSC
MKSKQKRSIQKSNSDSSTDEEQENIEETVTKTDINTEELCSNTDNSSDDNESDATPCTSRAVKKSTKHLQITSESDTDENDLSEQVRMPVLNPLNLIRNKEKRMALFRKMKKEKHKKKMQERRARRKAGIPANPGHTIESLRETDQTVITNLDDSDNEELRKELETDDFSTYFQCVYEPKVLITFADNPVTKTRKFGLELGRIFPNALVKIRNRSSVKKICKSAIREEYTDVVIINEDRRKPNGLLVIHLPNGPTAHFKLSNVKLTTDIKRDHKEISKHRPEVILNNFTTRLGLTIGRMLGALFHHDPEFKGRRVATFHNQRDYIFFRHHRYEFSKDGKRAKLRELGPRFTLKLRSLQEGTFDSKTGDYIWIITNKRHSMEASRRRFHL